MDPAQRGVEAQQLLNNPLLKEAFNGVRQKITQWIEDSAAGDESTHHTLALHLQSLKLVKKYMENWVRDGELEADRAARAKRARTGV